MVIGPCSIHDPAAALEYARKLKAEREKYADTLEIVMRVYFEKPRTTVGWKGLINDPYLDESYRIHEGLRIARQLLVDINRLGVPAAGEFLDVISPQYIGDLISWGAIGARTTESQVHRELASGLSAPVGFKNGTDGNLKIAIDAIQAAARPHHFLSVHKNGQVAIVETARQQGLPRDPARRQGAQLRRGERRGRLRASSRPPSSTCKLMIDFSHANSEKKYERQVTVARDVGDQVAGGQPLHLRRDGREPPHRRRAEVHAGQGRPGDARIRQEHHRRLHRLGRLDRRAGRAARRGARRAASGADARQLTSGSRLRASRALCQ